jgi:hypothetical protein
MATTGKGTPLASGPDEDQAGFSVTADGSLPAERLDTGAQEAQEETHPGRSRAQRAILLEQAKEAAAKLAELMGELAESGASTPPDDADLENRLKAAAAVLQMAEPRSQLAHAPENAERAVAVGVLRAERSGTESRWQCKVLTCAESYHPLVACLQFLLMSRRREWTWWPLPVFAGGASLRATGSRSELVPSAEN